ncbi:hypothetical protein IL59_0213160 [Brucella suis bv. 4 str. 40]|nr:hypothetical protein IL59_0213160 [Brucella suis bv. 4 str. 40]
MELSHRIAAGNEERPGEDFVCMRYPGTQGAVTFNSDMFAMFKVSEDKVPAQLEMASAIESAAFQSAFNVVKGSVPARTDVPDTAFDACGKKAMPTSRKQTARAPCLALWHMAMPIRLP